MQGETLASSSDVDHVQPSNMKGTIMAGGGEYSRHNGQGYATADKLKPFVLNAVKTALVSVKQSTTFTYCDFGAADGGMAAIMAQAVVHKVRTSHRKDGDVSVIFEDQALNDFGPILSKFQQDVRRLSHDVFVSVVGESFYEQCVASRSVDLSVSFTSAHWLNVENDEDITEELYDKVNCMRL